MTERLFHIVDRATWQAALSSGEYRPASLAGEGFVHCSFAAQVAGTANLRFGGVDGLCVVEIDPALLAVPVVVEDSYGSGTEFPHVYGPIPTSAAVTVHRLDRGPAGKFAFSPDGAGGGAGSASTGR